MKTYREWEEQKLLNERPHVDVVVDENPELDIINGSVDFGFENLGLSKEKEQELSTSLMYGNGVSVPNSNVALKMGVLGKVEVISNKGQLVMPPNWKQGAYTLDGNTFTWIGKLVRPDQIGEIDYSLYDETEDGWKLKEQ